MYMPNGQPAQIDKIMLLAMWSRQLDTEGRPILFAGMSNPTFPVNIDIVSARLKYWSNIISQSNKAHDLLSAAYQAQGSQESEISAIATLRDQIATGNSCISYGDPHGETAARETLATALNNWYGPSLEAKADHIVLPVGGSGGLYAIFGFINKKKPANGVIVTPFPYYTLYQGAEGQNKLHPIHVMNQPGYRLTAAALRESLDNAKKQGLPVNAFLFCDPNNPLGTVVSKEEWEKIAKVLRDSLAREKDLPDDKRTPIILDEAYAEMGLYTAPTSLLTIAPDLAPHIIMMRSATKGLSAAGERMALLFTKNQYFLNEYLSGIINIYGHSSTSSQQSFAEGLRGLTKAKLQEMADYYRPQLEIVHTRAHSIGVNMPDKAYKPEGTFYILLDLSELIGMPLHPGAKKAVGEKNCIETDEDICYHLLFSQGVMIAPLSYFGLDSKKGFLRVTCSGGDTQLNQIMNRIALEVGQARIKKANALIDQLATMSATLQALVHSLNEDLSSEAHTTATNLINQIGQVTAQPRPTLETVTDQPVLALKTNIEAMSSLLKSVNDFLNTVDPQALRSRQEAAKTRIVTWYRAQKERRIVDQHIRLHTAVLAAQEQLSAFQQLHPGRTAPILGKHDLAKSGASNSEVSDGNNKRIKI